jgi:hypothetical protein
MEPNIYFIIFVHYNYINLFRTSKNKIYEEVNCSSIHNRYK